VVEPTIANVVFVHGAANDHSVFALQSRYFAYHGLNVYAVDLPGHGQSNGQALTSVEALADWLVAFLDAVNAKNVSLIGHSLGSLIALETAARYPERVGKVALLATAVPMTVSAELLAAAAANDHVAFEMINSWSFSLPRHLGGNRWPGVWMTGNAMRLMERMQPNVLHADLVACRDYANGLRAAAMVRCPALLLLGGRDIMAPTKATRELAKILGDARIVTLAECGHSMMSEEPDAVLDELRRFLQ
jgi:pimeloyl-ACP methyl ester carboxylesterase